MHLSAFAAAQMLVAALRARATATACGSSSPGVGRWLADTVAVLGHPSFVQCNLASLACVRVTCHCN
jgi:hypothetical protein